MRRVTLRAAALAAALGFAGALSAGAAETPKARVVYTVGIVEPMPDADDMIATLTARLTMLELEPRVRQQGNVLMIEVDAPEDEDAVALLLTRTGRFAIYAADAIVESCDGVQPGELCLPTIEPKAPFVTVEPAPVLGHAALARAVPILGEGRIPQVALSFTGPATQTFAEFTRAREGRRIAIVLDGTVITAPRIHGAVTSGTAVLAGPGIPAVAWAVMLANPPLRTPLSILALEPARSDN